MMIIMAVTFGLWVILFVYLLYRVALFARWNFYLLNTNMNTFYLQIIIIKYTLKTQKSWEVVNQWLNSLRLLSPLNKLDFFVDWITTWPKLLFCLKKDQKSPARLDVRAIWNKWGVEC